MKRPLDDEDGSDEVSIFGDLRCELTASVLEVEPVTDVVGYDGSGCFGCGVAVP